MSLDVSTYSHDRQVIHEISVMFYVAGKPVKWHAIELGQES